MTKTVDSTIGNLQSKVAWLHVPAGGFAVHVVVDQTFVPDDYDHRGDKRQLGVDAHVPVLPDQAAQMSVKRRRRIALATGPLRSSS